MPHCLLEEGDFRIVETDEHGSTIHVLEVRDGCDALGVERWRTFKMNNATERALFGYILRILKKEQGT